MDDSDVIWVERRTVRLAFIQTTWAALIALNLYGRLYNWYAVDDARGLCPSGWHVPTMASGRNWKDYITSQGFSGTEGTALKIDLGMVLVVATARTTLGFRPFRAAAATTQWRLLRCRELGALVEFVSQWRRCLATGT